MSTPRLPRRFWRWRVRGTTAGTRRRSLAISALERGVKIWDLGREIAEVFGVLKAELEGDGRRLDDFDLAIAACALVNDLTLVTSNEGHFGRIRGLRLENWAARLLHR
jgi:predicted nucleic acid-binding protein